MIFEYGPGHAAYLLSVSHRPMIALLDDIGQASGQEEDSGRRAEAVFSAFQFALETRPRLLEAAAEIMDEATITEFRTKDTGRVVWKVRSSKDKDYTVLERYCSCRSFFESSKTGLSDVLCKHVLAVRMARAVGSVQVEQCPDDVFATIFAS